MGGNTGKINKPAKRKKARRKQCARQGQQDQTTREKLRQNRSNPHANVRLSGKKKRQLLKEAKRMVAEQLVVDASAMAIAQLQERCQDQQNGKENMDID